MIKIIRKRHFFRQYSNLIMGLLWLSIGIAYYFIEEPDVFNFLFVFNLIIGLTYLVFYFYQKERNQEFIAWDEEQVILSKWQLKPVTYPFSEVNQITFTNSYFIFKPTPDTPGETMKLSGYSESDINLLKRRFSPELVSGRVQPFQGFKP